MIVRKNILLLSPPSVTHRTPEENLGLEYLAAELRGEGHRVDYLDAFMLRLSSGEVIDKVVQLNPDILGLSPSMDSFENCQEIIKGARTKSFKGLVVMGGVYASFEPEDLLRSSPGNPDIILRGEADLTFKELAEGKLFENLSGAAYLRNYRVVLNPFSCGQIDLDKLPLPVRPTFSLVRQYKTPSHVMGSRGCYGNCSFCSVASFQKFSSLKRWRGRNPRSIVSELVELSRKGETMVKFIDDNFFGHNDKKREKEFANLLIDSGIKIRFRLSLRANDVDEEIIPLFKKAGLFAVSIGIESFVQRKLNDYGKGVSVKQNLRALEILKKNGILVQMGHIMFDPYVSIDEIKEEIRYLNVYSWVVTKGICTKLFAAEGTRITERIRNEVGFTGKEGTNNNYDIIDTKAREFYEACRLWVKHSSFLYDMAIDPISAPKNIPHKELLKFHKICVDLKKLDLIVSGRILEKVDNSGKGELENIVKNALVEFNPDLMSINQKTNLLYKSTGLNDVFLTNTRI